MSPEKLLRQLQDVNVLTTTGGQITVTQQYQDAYTDFRSRFEAGADPESVLGEDSERLSEIPLEQSAGVELLARYAALEQLVPDLDVEERFRVLIGLLQLKHADQPDSGVPEGFLSLDGDYLPALLPVLGRAVVYVWLKDCDPCEVMSDDLQKVFANSNDDILPLAVYGPHSASMLQEEYDIAGGPVTLFVHDGSIDSRLQGAHYEDVIESEIRSLRSMDDKAIVE